MKWSSYLLGILAILFLASSLRATELIVATTADVVNGNTLTPDDLKRDPGPDGISLREAILACNNTPGPHTITFSQTIAGQVITPDTSLPVITQGQVAIAGIQSGDGQPAITIDARGLPIGGFSVLGSNFAVKRLRFIGLNFGG